MFAHRDGDVGNPGAARDDGPGGVGHHDGGIVAAPGKRRADQHPAAAIGDGGGEYGGVTDGEQRIAAGCDDDTPGGVTGETDVTGAEPAGQSQILRIDEQGRDGGEGRQDGGEPFAGGSERPGRSASSHRGQRYGEVDHNRVRTSPI